MHNRVSISADHDARIIIIRVVGNVEGSDFVETVMSRFADFNDPWAYAHLLDFRHKESMTLSEDVERLAKWWEDLRAGRTGEYTAVVTTDPVFKARMSFFKTVFPDRVIQGFDTMDEGLDWLKSRAPLAEAG